MTSAIILDEILHDAPNNRCNIHNIMPMSLCYTGPRNGSFTLSQPTKGKIQTQSMWPMHTRECCPPTLHLQVTYAFMFAGLRYVHPYYFTFKTYCKRRWVGRPLLEVFKEEFRSETPEYYVSTNRSHTACETLVNTFWIFALTNIIPLYHQEKAIKSGKITGIADP